MHHHRFLHEYDDHEHENHEHKDHFYEINVEYNDGKYPINYAIMIILFSLILILCIIKLKYKNFMAFTNLADDTNDLELNEIWSNNKKKEKTILGKIFSEDTLIFLVLFHSISMLILGILGLYYENDENYSVTKCMIPRSKYAEIENKYLFAHYMVRLNFLCYVFIKILIAYFCMKFTKWLGVAWFILFSVLHLGSLYFYHNVTLQHNSEIFRLIIETFLDIFILKECYRLYSSDHQNYRIQKRLFMLMGVLNFISSLLWYLLDNNIINKILIDLVFIFHIIVLLYTDLVALFCLEFLKFMLQDNARVSAFFARISLSVPHLFSSHHLGNKLQEIDFIDFDDIQLDELPFAAGANGQVYKGQWQGIMVAAKCVFSQMLVDDTKEILKECAILMKISHPNIVRFYGISKDFHSGRLFLLTELCPYLLLTIVKEHSEWYQKNHIQLAINLCAAVKYLGGKNLSHNDLKPANILLDHNFNIKICDLGMTVMAKHQTKSCSNNDDDSSNNNNNNNDDNNIILGTPPFTPPEVISIKENEFNHMKPHQNGLVSSWDMFSLSMVFYFMWTKKMPFDEMSTANEMMTAISHGKRPLLPTKVADNDSSQIIIPSAFSKMIKKMWHQDPHQRFSNIDEVINILVDLLDNNNDTNNNDTIVKSFDNPLLERNKINNIAQTFDKPN